MNFLKKWYQGFMSKVPKDPVKHCKIHKTIGCAHVDGFLCNVETCDAEIEATITVKGIVVHERPLPKLSNSDLNKLLDKAFESASKETPA